MLMGLTAALLWLGVLRHKPAYKDMVGKCLPKMCAVSLCVVLSLAFVNRDRGISEFLGIYVPRISGGVIILLLSAGLCVGITVYQRLVSRIVLYVYMAFGAIMVMWSLVFPVFSVRNASAEIARICEDGQWVIGFGGHELAFGNKLRPLLWIPKWYEDVNMDAVEKYKPRCYLILRSWEGKEPPEGWPKPEDINASLVYVETFRLWPVFGRARAIIELYRID